MKNLSLLIKGGILCLCLMALNPSILCSQTLQANYGAPTASISVCDGNSTFKVKILGSSSSCDTAILSIVLPHGYNYVSGSATRVDTNGTITPLTPSGDTTRLQITGIPASPDSVVISYQAYADCSATDTTSSADAAAKYILSGHCLASSYSVTSNTVHTQSAALSVSNVTNNNYSGTIGGTYTRAITIANTGIGTVSSIIFQDTIGRGLSLTSVSVTTGWTLTKTSTVSGTDTLQIYALTGPSLAQGQQIVVTENLTIMSQCYLQSRMFTYFGCKSTPCTNNNVTGSATAGATSNNSQAPNVKIITTGMNALMCRGTDYTQTMAITNIGNAPLTNFTGNIFSSTWSAVAGTQYFNSARSYISGGQSGYSSIKYKYGVNGTYITLPLDSVKYFSSPGGSITGLPSSFYFTIPRINAGDTVYVTYQERNNFIGGANSGNTMEVSGNELWYSYLDACGNRTTPTATFLRNYVQTRINNDASLPSTMEQATTYSFAYTFSESNSGIYIYTDPTTGSTIRFDLILPANITFTGNVSNINFYKGGSTYGSPSSYSYNTGTNTISVTYKISSTFTINGLLSAVLTYDKMMLNCAATYNNNTVTLNTYLKASSTCTNEEQMSTLPIKVGLACPVACTSAGGLSFNGFTLARTNYGKPDNDNNGVADASGSLNYSTVKTNYALLGDTLQATFNGKISVTASSPSAGYKYGMAIDTIPSSYTSYFTNLYASVQLYAAGATTPFYTCNNLPVGGTTTSYRKVDFSISSLNAVCALPSGYTKYNDGDSVVVSIYYKVSGSLPTALTTVPITNAFGISTAAITTQAQIDQYACGAKYSGRAVVIGKGTGNATGNLTYTSSGTSNVTLQGTNVGFLGPCCVYGGSKPFANEYRSVTIYDSASFVMPAGYDYVSATVTYTYTTGLGTSASKTVSVTPTNSGTTLIYNLKALFEGGSLPYGDQGSVMSLYPVVKPNCAATARAVGTIYIRQIPTPGSGFTFANYTSMQADTIYLTSPNLTVTPTVTTATTAANTGTWELQVANSNTVTANNVWIAKNNSGGNITITSVQKLSGSGGSVVSTITPTSGIYQLGNFGQTNAYYRITGTSNGCNKDSIPIAYWYDCSNSGYPSVVTAQIYRKSFYLYIQPQQASMQLSIIQSPSSGAHNLCEQLNYGLEASNAGSADANSPKIIAYLPNSGGASYVAGTYTLEYPIGSGTYVSVSDTYVSISGNNVTFTVPTTYFTKLASNQKMRIRFGLQTDCHFTSGLSVRFAASATSACGSTSNSITQQSERILMTGAPTATNVYKILSYVDSAKQSCNSTSDLTTNYRFVLINQGPAVSGSSDLYSIELPPSWAMSTSSITYLRNPSGASYDHTSGSVYYFTMGGGLAVGDSLVMTATLSLDGSTASSLTSGSTDPIQELALMVYTGTCSTSGAACPSSQAVAASRYLTTIPYSNSLGGASNTYGYNAQWNGYMYQGTAFSTYKGMVNEAGGQPNFDESFGGAAVNYATNACAVYTENFSARYMLSQTFMQGSYKVTVGGGDGYRFSIDGGSTWTINKWTAHSYDTTSTILNLNGGYNFVIEYYANTGANRVSFKIDTLYVLPVTLQSFTGSLVDGEMHLKWKVGNNLSGSRFIVGRAARDYNYSPLGTINGVQGTTDYGFIDPSPLQGRSYYRLGIVDQSGSTTYSSVIPLILDGNSGPILLVFPTFITGQRFYLESDKPLNNLKLTIGDMNGRVLKMQAISRLEGGYRYEIDGSGCFGVKGIYTVFITADELNAPVVKKLLLQ